MIYIVLMPVKSDNVHKLVITQKDSFSEVREMLGLPQAWMSWVSLAQIEIDMVLLDNQGYIEKLISRNSS